MPDLLLSAKVTKKHKVYVERGGQLGFPLSQKKRYVQLIGLRRGLSILLLSPNNHPNRSRPPQSPSSRSSPSCPELRVDPTAKDIQPPTTYTTPDQRLRFIFRNS